MLQRKRMAQKVTRHLEIREGFPEEEATCDPTLKRQEGSCVKSGHHPCTEGQQQNRLVLSPLGPQK